MVELIVICTLCGAGFVTCLVTLVVILCRAPKRKDVTTSVVDVDEDVLVIKRKS